MLAKTPKEMVVKIFQKMEPISMTRSLRCSKKALQIAPCIHMYTGLFMEVIATSENSTISVYQDQPRIMLYSEEIPRDQLNRAMKSFEPFKFTKITLYGLANVMRDIFVNTPIRSDVVHVVEHFGAALELITAMRPSMAFMNINSRRPHRIQAVLENLPLDTLMSTAEAVSVALNAIPRRISIDIHVGDISFQDQVAIMDTIVSSIRKAQTTGACRTFEVTVKSNVATTDLITLMYNSARRIPNAYWFYSAQMFQYQWGVAARSTPGISAVLLKGNIGEMNGFNFWTMAVSPIETYGDTIPQLSTFFDIPENHAIFNFFRHHQAAFLT